MFKLEGFCDDKHVVTIMKSLSGKVMDFKMLPVANAVAKNGKVAAKVEGDTLELLAAYIKQHKLTVMSVKQLKEFTVSIGRAESSYSIYLQRGIENRLLKHKPDGTYQVIK